MPDREAALAAVRRHLDDALDDPRCLLGAQAMDAAHVLAGVTDPGHDLAAAHALGWYHWVRHLVLPQGLDRDDLAAAVPLLALVHRARPGSTPEALHGTLERIVADDPVPDDDDDSAAAALHEQVLELLRAYERTQRRELLEQAVSVMRTLVTALPGEHPARAPVLNSLGFSLRRLVERGGSAELLEEAVRVSRQSVDASAAEDPDRAWFLTNLGCHLRLWSEHVGQVSLLEEAVEVSRQAVVSSREEDPRHALCLGNLTVALRLLFGRTGEVRLLAEAVEVSRRVISRAADNHSERAEKLAYLGIDLISLFERTGDIRLPAEAVEVSRRAVALTPDDQPEHPGRLSSLATALHVLYERADGGVRVLEEAVDAGRRAAAATPVGDPDRAPRLTNLGIDLQALYECNGRVEILKEAVRAGREAVAAAGSVDSAAVHLNPLGASLRFLFECTDDLDVLDEAVQVSRQAVAAAPADDHDHAMYLNNLGSALQRLSERTGEPEALDEAVRVGRAAVDATGEEDPQFAVYLSNLGLGLRLLFERGNELDLLDEAIRAGRRAVDITRDGHPKFTTYLNNLGLALRARFEHTGDIAALREALRMTRQVAARTTDGAPDRPAALCNLANTLRVLYERTADLDALDEAVQVSRRAVAAVPEDHPHLSATYTSLRNALQRLFEEHRETAVLDEAVQVSRRAVSAVPDDHPDRAMHLGNLGVALQVLAEHTGRPDVLDEAVRAGRAALDATPADHPDRVTYLNLLGDTLQLLSERTESPGLMAEACACYRVAAHTPTGATMSRIRAYRFVARLSSGPDAAPAALEAVEAAIDLAGALAPGSLARADREHQLSRLTGLAGEAAAAALGAGRPVRAVELLERTRGILAAETLGIRGRDTARLREHAPGLADEFDRLRARLDALDRPRSVSAQENTATEAALAADRRLADDRRAAHTAWQGLLARIRALPGFDGFLQVPPIDRLTRDAHEGPIVFVVSSHGRCDALLLADTPGSPVRAVPLNGLTHEIAIAQADRLQAALDITTDAGLSPGERAAAQQEILTVLAWLWDTVAEPVLAALGHTGAPGPGTLWPRLWWCPVGVLSAFPLHAAGHHADPLDRPGGRRSVLDRVVSSYATTVRALAHARAHDAGTKSLGTLIVPAADAPGTASLPGVRSETRILTRLVPDARLLVPATRATVLHALPAHRVAHFSCHGYADWDDPARSHLVLHDHATAPLTLADITALDLTADLAYLSACDTGVTAPRLADESLHITGACHLAGYQQVIGTLWPVDDRIAAALATDFYTHLTDAGTAPPRTRGSAHALHHATTRLRDRYPHTPSLWAAYTHTGR